jgi:hypothetical protein
MSGRAPPANGPDGGSGGTRIVELAGRGGRLPTDNIGIGIYGGEGCRGKRKVVCYPAGGGRASSVQVHPQSAVNSAGTRVFPPSLWTLQVHPQVPLILPVLGLFPLVIGTLQVHPQVLLIQLRHIA